MFKKIPGNTEYLIDLKKQVIDSYGNLVYLERNRDKTVRVVMFGKERKVTEEWLSLLACFEYDVIGDLNSHLDKIKFYPIELSNMSKRCKSLSAFSEPIYYREGFRYIPNFPRYAINIDSEVIDTFTNKILTEKSYDSGYENFYVYDPTRNFFRMVRIHRLLAFAWLPNNDFINRPIINHIDGNKLNNKLSNLEWCSPAHNSRHALEIGLNSCSIKMKTRDVVTGEIVIYQSATEMAKKIGMTGVSASFCKNRLPGFLYKKRYEIKIFDDETPWYYENHEWKDGDSVKSIYTITVMDKTTGEVKKYNNTNTFFKTYSLWPASCRLDDAVVLFKNKYKDLEVSYVKNSMTGPYRVLNLVDKKVVVFDSIWKAAEHIGLSRTELQFDLQRQRKFIYFKQWVVVAGTDEISLENYKEKPKPYNKIVITSAINPAEIIIADSIHRASSMMKVQPMTIRRNLDTGNLVKGYIYRTLES